MSRYRRFVDGVRAGAVVSLPTRALVQVAVHADANFVSAEMVSQLFLVVFSCSLSSIRCCDLGSWQAFVGMGRWHVERILFRRQTFERLQCQKVAENFAPFTLVPTAASPSAVPAPPVADVDWGDFASSSGSRVHGAGATAAGDDEDADYGFVPSRKLPACGNLSTMAAVRCEWLVETVGH